MNKLVHLGILKTALMLGGCATLVNDAYIPIEFSFSDGSTGQCHFSNKRGGWTAIIPGSAMIRRSDDNLKYKCETNDGRQTNSEVHSGVESGKVGMFDLGFTDSITDKHRTYQRNVVIPVELKK